MIPCVDFTAWVSGPWNRLPAGFKEIIDFKSSRGKDPEQPVLVIKLALLWAERWAAGLQRSFPSQIVPRFQDPSCLCDYMFWLYRNVLLVILEQMPSLPRVSPQLTAVSWNLFVTITDFGLWPCNTEWLCSREEPAVLYVFLSSLSMWLHALFTESHPNPSPTEIIKSFFLFVLCTYCYDIQMLNEFIFISFKWHLYAVTRNSSIASHFYRWEVMETTGQLACTKDLLKVLTDGFGSWVHHADISSLRNECHI